MNLDKQEQTSQGKSPEGLPDIAHQKRINKLALVVFGLGLVLVIGFSLLKHEHPKTTAIKPMEETYTVPNNNHSVSVAKSTVVTQSPSQPKNTLSPQQQALLLQLVQTKQKQLQDRLQAQMLVFNNANTTSGNHTAVLSDAKSNANAAFADELSSEHSDVVVAQRLASLHDVILQGSVIHAILETAINSDLPGLLRATVGQNVYAEDGSQMLIPEGSRLIGQYRSEVAQGQSRVFVEWTRLITPSGVSINISSPGVDSLGEAGMSADVVNRHFMQNFGQASLLSLLSAGASNVGVGAGNSYNSASSYRIAIADSLSQSASQSLSANGGIPPTLIIPQGTPLIVFVAHDIHFRGALEQQNSLNVF